MTESNIKQIDTICEATSLKPTKTSSSKSTKTEKLIRLLNSKRGVSIEQLQQASSWQAHSVRGFLSGTVKKKLGLTLKTETGKDGLRRYRIDG